MLCNDIDNIRFIAVKSFILFSVICLEAHITHSFP
uniref:Uncharacterized protein n=1 Tax=Anguilla anguilla TaxID=7936 RepID=A0A0E9Q6X5_ANGAN